MPSPGNVQRVRAKQMEEAAARKALKAQRREENERNRLAKEACRGDSSVHERDSMGTPMRRRLMPVYLLEFCARPHGVSRALQQCRTGVAHRAFGGLTCTGMPGGVSQATRPGHHKDAVRTSLRLFWKGPAGASAGGRARPSTTSSDPCARAASTSIGWPMTTPRPATRLPSQGPRPRCGATGPSPR